MNKKSVYTCDICSALFVCLKFFQEHRKKHYIEEGQTVYPCTHCQELLHERHEVNLHSQSHKNEAPHSCEICQKMLGISEEEVLGTRRSVGTATDFHVFNLYLDKPMNADEVEGDRHHQNNNDHNVHDGVDDDDDDDDDEDDDDDDDDDEDDDEEEDEEEEEEEEDEHVDNEELAICKQNVTNIIYVSNQTINHTTTSQQKNYLKPSRPSRSTGKGKGNRKARLTSDDIKRKFSCSHCGKSFKTKSHLQRHILTHTGEKPYHCNRCDCRFNQSSSLRNHVIALHTKEYPHICNNCSKGFLMPAVLQKHLQTSECGKVSNQVVEGL